MPVRSTEIIIGKYLTVVAIALISACANLVSMGIAFNNMQILDPMQQATQLTLSSQGQLDITPGLVGEILLLLIPSALFFSALMLTISTFAKDFKEGQNLLTPAYLACVVPAALVSTPSGFEFDCLMALVPVVNVVLAVKGVLTNEAPMVLVTMMLVANSVYAGLMLWTATRVYGNERIMWGTIHWRRLVQRSRH
jgi:ABC-type Na+ efflux pump permease subunit